MTLPMLGFFVYAAVAASILILAWPMRPDLDRDERVAVVAIALFWPIVLAVAAGFVLFVMPYNPPEE